MSSKKNQDILNKEISNFMNKNLILAHPEDDALITFEIMKETTQ